MPANNPQDAGAEAHACLQPDHARRSAEVHPPASHESTTNSDASVAKLKDGLARLRNLAKMLDMQMQPPNPSTAKLSAHRHAGLAAADALERAMKALEATPPHTSAQADTRDKRASASTIQATTNAQEAPAPDPPTSPPPPSTRPARSMFDMADERR